MYRFNRTWWSNWAISLCSLGPENNKSLSDRFVVDVTYILKYLGIWFGRTLTVISVSEFWHCDIQTQTIVLYAGIMLDRQCRIVKIFLSHWVEALWSQWRFPKMWTLKTLNLATTLWLMVWNETPANYCNEHGDNPTRFHNYLQLVTMIAQHQRRSPSRTKVGSGTSRFLTIVDYDGLMQPTCPETYTILKCHHQT